MRLRAIVNPAAGEEEPVLAVLARVLDPRGIDWDVAVTRGGDAERLAAGAAEEGFDVVAAYGGDGTVSAVAAGLAGRDTPLAVLPGGTGNVIAQELGVPLELAEAVALACDGRPAALDTLRVEGRLSLLRVGIGADARMIRESTRERKNELGWGAYLLSALRQVTDPRRARYAVELDGRELETDAVACVVANIGRIGRGGLSLSATISPFDGALDVLLIRTTDIAAVTSVAASLFGVHQPPELDAEEDAPVVHGQGRRVAVRAEPDQPVHVDGDPVGRTPVEVEVAPGQLRVVLPADGEWAAERADQARWAKSRK